MGETAKYSNVHYSGNSAFAIGNDSVIGEPRSEFFRRRRRCRPLVIFTVLLILALLLGLILVSLLYFSSKIDLCKSEECLRIAASLKESMNLAVDPCDDFYEFTCGRWQNSHTQMCPSILTEQEYSWFRERTDITSRRIKDLIKKKPRNEEPEIIKQARLLFKSCANTVNWEAHGLNPLKSLLKDLKVSEVPSVLSGKTSNLVNQLAELKKNLDSDLYFRAEVLQDPRNHTKKIVAFGIPELQTPFPAQKVDKNGRLEKLETLEKRVLRYKLKSAEDDNSVENDKDVSFTDIYKNVSQTYIYETLRYVLSNGTISGESCDSTKLYSGISDEQIRQAAERIFEFERHFKEITDYHRNNATTIKNLADSRYMTLEELQMDIDEFIRSFDESLKPLNIWKPFVEEIFSDSSTGENELFNSDDTFLIKNLEYLRNISLFLAKTDTVMQESFLWWKVVDYYTPFSPKTMRDFRDNYLRKLNLGGVVCQRSVVCAEHVTELLGLAVSRLFVDANFQRKGFETSSQTPTKVSNGSIADTESSALVSEPSSFIDSSSVDSEQFENVAEMLGNLRAAFSESVKKAIWMDEHTKEATLEKQNKMETFVGYPKWIFNDTALNQLLLGVELDSDSYFDNVMMLIKINSFRKLKAYADPDHDNAWTWDPMEVNAIYLPPTNQIAIPLGILQFPFYQLGLEALNFGALGAIIGHELVHGFDNSGRLLDSDGSLKEWWSNETSDKYVEIAECFVAQYDQIYETEVEESVDGERTLDENIADNGGLTQVYNAYQSWKKKHGKELYLPGFTDFTHEQLLFLGYAHMWCESYTSLGLKWMLDDDHSPRHVRVRAVLANSKQFSDTWKCPVGSKMNPVKKCQLW